MQERTIVLMVDLEHLLLPHSRFEHLACVAGRPFYTAERNLALSSDQLICTPIVGIDSKSDLSLLDHSLNLLQ